MSKLAVMESSAGIAAGSVADWRKSFEPLLGSTARWEGLSYIVRDLLERERPVIVETGTLREPANWAGDGCSTLIWDWVAQCTDGYVYSVDINEKPAGVHYSSRVQNVVIDSVKFMRAFWPSNHGVDLLYLDSYDYSPGNELNACMHQVAELSAIWERLPSGCLIASDDSHSPDQGKPALTRRLLSAIGVNPVLDSYIVVWRKP